MPLLALFIVVPLIEIALFIQIGSAIGLGWTLLIVVLTAVAGTVLVRQQGRDVLTRLQSSFEQLRDPTEPLAHGAMILFSGALLLTPGFFTDAVGFALLIPAVREAAFRWLRARVTMTTFSTDGTRRAGPHGPRPERRPPPRAAGDVIEGDYTEVDAGAQEGDEDDRRGDASRPGEPPQRDRPRRPSGWSQP
jgi:UPF0716 protein FxsA